MHIRSNSQIRKGMHNLIAFVLFPLGLANCVEVSVGAYKLRPVNHVRDTKLLAAFVIAANDLTPPLKHFRVAFQLNQPHGGADIGHIAFVPWADNIILPSIHQFFCKGVPVVAVQGEHLIHLVQFLIGDALRVHGLGQAPGACTSLCCGQVFYGLEGEGGALRNASSAFPFGSVQFSSVAAVYKTL